MNRWLKLMDEETIEEDLELLSTDDLQNYQFKLEEAINRTIDMISCYAEMAATIDPQFQRVIALENYFTRLSDKLHNTIIIIGGSALLFERQRGDMRKRYGNVLSKAIALVQGVRIGKNITAEWLEQRDEFVAQARRILDANPIPDDKQGKAPPS